MITPTYITEINLSKNFRFIAGVDEVGVAPLAGPVVSAVVILNPEKIGVYRSKTKWWRGVRDSKTLSAKKRESLVDFIRQNAYDFGIGVATHKEIDEINIHEATSLSMQRAVENLKILPEIILIDGKYKIPGVTITQQAIINGDARVLSIAAASILAKVHRDDLMKKFSEKFPNYGFEKHKGYGTAFHRKRLLEHGPCEIHRMSFSTIQDIIKKRFERLMVG